MPLILWDVLPKSYHERFFIVYFLSYRIWLPTDVHHSGLSLSLIAGNQVVRQKYRLGSSRLLLCSPEKFTYRQLSMNSEAAILISHLPSIISLDILNQISIQSLWKFTESILSLMRCAYPSTFLRPFTAIDNTAQWTWNQANLELNQLLSL